MDLLRVTNETFVAKRFRPRMHVPVLGTGLLSESEGLVHSSHAGPERIEMFTYTIELLRRFVVVSSRKTPSYEPAFVLLGMRGHRSNHSAAMAFD